MGPWGFVFLAYGIVWAVVLVYLLFLKHRLSQVATELERQRTSEDAASRPRG